TCVINDQALFDRFKKDLFPDIYSNYSFSVNSMSTNDDMGNCAVCNLIITLFYFDEDRIAQLIRTEDFGAILTSPFLARRPVIEGIEAVENVIRLEYILESLVYSNRTPMLLFNYEDLNDIVTKVSERYYGHSSAPSIKRAIQLLNICAK